MPLPEVFVMSPPFHRAPRLRPSFRALRAATALTLGLGAAFALSQEPLDDRSDHQTVRVESAEGQHKVSVPPMVTAREDANEILAAAHRYRGHVGDWPLGLESLRREGELSATRRDPWGGRYRFFFDAHRTRIAVCAGGRPQPALTSVCFW